MGFHGHIEAEFIDSTMVTCNNLVGSANRVGVMTEPPRGLFEPRTALEEAN